MPGKFRMKLGVRENVQKISLRHPLGNRRFERAGCNGRFLPGYFFKNQLAFLVNRQKRVFRIILINFLGGLTQLGF